MDIELLKQQLISKRLAVTGGLQNTSIQPRVVEPGSDPNIVRQNFVNNLQDQRQGQDYIIQPKEFSPYQINVVKKIESVLLKSKIKEWFDFCLTSGNSFSDTLVMYNIVSKDRTFEMIYNLQEETAFVDIDNAIVSVKTNNVNEVLDKLIFTKSQLASFYMKPIFTGGEAPYIKVIGYNEFLVGREEQSIQLTNRIVNALNVLSQVPDEILNEKDVTKVIEFIIRLELQKQGKTIENKKEEVKE